MGEPTISFEGFRDARYVIQYRDGERILDAYFFDVAQEFPAGIGNIRVFYDIWKSKLLDDKLPAWKNFKFEDFKGWHSNMRVVERRDAQIGKTTQLILGEKYAELWGNTTFKQSLEGEIRPSSSTIKKLKKHIKYLHEPNICLGVGTLPKHDSSYQPTFWLELPMSEDGTNITHFLNAVQPVYNA